MGPFSTFGGGGYSESSWTLNKWVLSLSLKLVSDTAVLTTAGSLFHQLILPVRVIGIWKDKWRAYLGSERLYDPEELLISTVQLRWGMFSTGLEETQRRLTGLGCWSCSSSSVLSPSQQWKCERRETVVWFELRVEISMDLSYDEGG